MKKLLIANPDVNVKEHYIMMEQAQSLVIHVTQQIQQNILWRKSSVEVFWNLGQNHLQVSCG